MPEQFIKVKHSDIQPATIFSDAIKKPDSGGIYGSSSNISNSNGDICRICHCESDTGNPLLSPCYCAGSLKYVHQACLQQWLAASDTRSCELCKFHFILHTKIKPISEWRRLEMSSIERRRLLCAILFHFVAAVCVVWSLFVLIDRAAEEVHRGMIAWPFWTKLVVVAVGFTGGAVFMYIQCRQYLHLFSRWKAHNRIILVQNAPEKMKEPPPSPTFKISINPVNLGELSSQVVANVECNVCPQYSENNPQESCYVFDEDSYKDEKYKSNRLRDEYAADDSFNRGVGDMNSTSDNIGLNSQKSENNAQSDATSDERKETNEIISVGANSCDALELNIQEILALDIEYSKRCTRSSGSGENHRIKAKSVFKSLPNLSASSENLLV